MREHQIVITLKPDQFLEVQRLARAANAKSMGVFVRQKLLAALGIEGSAAEALGASGNVDVEAVLADLKRVHSELRGFVAESLSPYSPEAFEQEQPEDAEQLRLFEESDVIPDTVHEDELEKLAEKTFAISPRLGAIVEDTPPAPAVAPLTVPDDSLSKHELHSRRDVHRSHHNDPLSKLLKEEEANIRPVKARVESEADDDTFDVPLSIAERRRQLAAARESAPEEEIASESPAEVAQEEASVVSQPAPAPSPQPQNETGRPLGYPPLSGSPPPKRRQV